MLISGVTSLNGARPFNSNGCMQDTFARATHSQPAKCNLFVGFSYRLVAPPVAFVLPKNVPTTER